MVFKTKDLRSAPTHTDVIYQDVKDMILTGKLKPNQRIRVREVAESFNVSIGPTREAIQKLVSEKYLSITSRSEIKVVDYGKKDFDKLMEIMRVLDIYAVKGLLKRISNKEIDELKKMNSKLNDYYKRKKIQLFANQANDIHKAIWALYDNDFICNTLTQAIEKITMIASNYLSYYSPEIFKKSWVQHNALIDAIEKRDARLLEKILIDHYSEDYFSD